MIKSVDAGMRSGTLVVPASKSMAHRKMICAALSNRPSKLVCEGLSKDIMATMRCLGALSAEFIQNEDAEIEIKPIDRTSFRGDSGKELQLYCGESGSTLRFILPIAAALGIPVRFHMEGKLSKRPHEELIAQLRAHGAMIYQAGELLYCSGHIQAGEYVIPGDISSQFISGLLFALPLLDGTSTLQISGRIESGAYIAMTEQAITESGIRFQKDDRTYTIPGRQEYCAEAVSAVERDWSNAAFFLCLGALSDKGITVKSMNPLSAQGDRNFISILRQFGAEVSITDGAGTLSADSLENLRSTDVAITVKRAPLHACKIDASEIPDLVPITAVLAAGAVGDTLIYGAARLRYKESDRLQATAALICSLGGRAEETADGLLIHGDGRLSGGEVNAFNDHRIAMSAAVAASLCSANVRINGAESVEKSYPAFFADFEHLSIL